MLLTYHGELSVHRILHVANHDQKKSLSKAQRESRNQLRGKGIRCVGAAVFATFIGKHTGFSDVSLFCFVNREHSFGENCCLFRAVTENQGSAAGDYEEHRVLEYDVVQSGKNLLFLGKGGDSKLLRNVDKLETNYTASQTIRRYLAAGVGGLFHWRIVERRILFSLWVITLRQRGLCYQSFGGINHLHLRGRRINALYK